jgi:hypothetical protein
MSAAVVTAFHPQPNDSTAVIKRYQDGFRAAEALVTFSYAVRYGGILVGGVVLVCGMVEFILNPAEHHGFAVVFASLIGCAVILTLIAQVLGRGLQGEGQLLLAAFDSDVNSSPFLSNAQRAQAMSLREKPPVPKCLPVWSE